MPDGGSPRGRTVGCASENGVLVAVGGTGVLVCVFVGVFVGVLVGVFVGVLVGVFVGVLVGVFVGVLVGVFVGVLVGVFVGAVVVVGGGGVVGSQMLGRSDGTKTAFSIMRLPLICVTSLVPYSWPPR